MQRCKCKEMKRKKGQNHIAKAICPWLVVQWWFCNKLKNSFYKTWRLLWGFLAILSWEDNFKPLIRTLWKIWSVNTWKNEWFLNNGYHNHHPCQTQSSKGLCLLFFFPLFLVGHEEGIPIIFIIYSFFYLHNSPKSFNSNFRI